MTMTLDVDAGKGQIERPGTGRRACLLPDQRFNRVVLHVRVCVSTVSRLKTCSSIQNQGSAEIVWLTT